MSLEMNILKALCLLVIVSPYISSSCAESGPSMGGACNYKNYEGQATIVSILPRSDNRIHPYIKHETHLTRGAYDGTYEIKFSFTSDRKIEEGFAQIEGKEFVMLLNDSTYPGPRFLEQYDIQVGKIFKCTMNVIVTGTCTPVLFDFPTIELNDYFEN